MTTRSRLTRLDAGDRALFVRWALTASTTGTARAFWRAVTNTGGATATLAASVVPLWLDGTLHEAAKPALLVLVVSHLMVQGSSAAWDAGGRLAHCPAPR